MRFFSVPTLGIVGAIAVGLCSFVPNRSETLPGNARAITVATKKPLLNEIASDDTGLGSVTTNNAIANVVADRQEAQAETNAISRLRGKVELLDRGKTSFSAVNDYTATFQKQEVVNGVLLDEQTIAIKCRHRPFSVYLNWLTWDVGREVIYIEGQNEGNMIAHDGGWKARIPALTLPTDCMLAMRDARYPVTTAGLIGLIEMMQRVHQEDLLRSNVESCDVDEHCEFDGRPCKMFVTTYKSPLDSKLYRKSMTWVDREWNVPLHTRHFEWPAAGKNVREDAIDEATLIECYSFTDLKINCNLTDHDFDRKNPEYRFR